MLDRDSDVGQEIRGGCVHHGVKSYKTKMQLATRFSVAIAIALKYSHPNQGEQEQVPAREVENLSTRDELRMNTQEDRDANYQRPTKLPLAAQILPIEVQRKGPLPPAWDLSVSIAYTESMLERYEHIDSE